MQLLDRRRLEPADSHRLSIRVAIHGLTNDPDPCPRRPSTRSDECIWYLRNTESGDGSFGRSDHRIEENRGIADGRVIGPIVSGLALRTHSMRLTSGSVGGGRREHSRLPAHGPNLGILADPNGRKTCGHSGSRASRRATRAPPRVIGIANGTRRRADISDATLPWSPFR